ncbi:MAG: Stp1/IreP family PP2C-type Ser/Thr phosphatase [Actinobacteria bacterium]|nr:Stp1/IreP family PP2C-type Ser/Thr phosphatase [Actinomycetota bacterium]MCL5882394.1 Stp1/IreP family PP2C-type Ser/Thr phosphatase [Actinomycetota bacterium]
MPPTFATATHTGLVRRSNEDSLFARTPVFAVADGMGGAQAGEVASGMAAQAFEWFAPQDKSPEQELARLIAKVNAGIHELAVSDPALAGMGTTLTAAVIRGEDVALAHVGDSRAYLWRQGALTQLTEDHSLVGEMVRSGQLTSAEAEEHPQRSIITRALGVDPEVQVDTMSVPWSPGDIFLLCSDGLHSMIPDTAIAAVLARGEDLRAGARELIKAAIAAGGRDNISLVLFSPDGSVAGETGSEPGSQTGKLRLDGSGPETFEAAEAKAPPGTAVGRIRAWLTTIPGRIVTGMALAVILLAGGWLVSRQLYYVGVEGDNVVIYRGVPYNLGPWSLSGIYRKSPVKYSELQPFEQDRVDQAEIQTQGGAETMLDNYSAEARQKKQEADRKAAEAAQTSTTPQTPTIPAGGLP